MAPREESKGGVLAVSVGWLDEQVLDEGKVHVTKLQYDVELFQAPKLALGPENLPLLGPIFHFHLQFPLFW